MANIECFVPSMEGDNLEVTVNSFSRSESFAGVTFLSGVSLRETDTLRSIAEAVSHKYILIYTKDTPLEMGMFALDRILAIAEDTRADMLYADHYELVESEGAQVRRRHPLIDCQKGALTRSVDVVSLPVNNPVNLTASSPDSMSPTLSRYANVTRTFSGSSSKMRASSSCIVGSMPSNSMRPSFSALNNCILRYMIV